jgi:hypothetical protein
MPDEPTTNAAPVPIRPHTAGEPSAPPPEFVVRRLQASLRATEMYVRIMIDRIELARISDLVRLDGAPTDALVQLTAISDALQSGANRTLGHLDPRLARKMAAVADLARRSASGRDHHPD